MRWKVVCLVAVSLTAGCVGPGQFAHGGRHGGFGRHHHHSAGDGILALLEGVALVADVVADISATQAALESQSRTVVVEPPPPTAPVRPLPAWFQGRVLLPSSRPTLPEIRLGVRSEASGRFQSILDSDSYGRFSFAVPPAGTYRLVVLDPEYQGEMAFTSDGHTAFPLEFPISHR